MSDFSVEKKLELVQQVRSQYYRNRSDLMNREQILYGNSYPATTTASEYETLSRTDTQETLLTDNTVKLRYLLSAVLLLLIILFDRSETSVAGISMEQIFTMIEADYGEIIEVWAETIEIPQ